MEEAKELNLTNGDASNVINEGQTESDPNSGSSFSFVNGFAFATLEPGRVYLVAITDVSGRGLFNYIQLKYCGPVMACTDAVVDSAPPHNLKEELVDLDGNGVDEIVAKTFVGGYEGNRTEPIYKYTVYKMVTGTSVDVSANYKTYYEATLLPRITLVQNRF